MRTGVPLHLHKYPVNHCQAIRKILYLMEEELQRLFPSGGFKGQLCTHCIYAFVWNTTVIGPLF